MSHAAGELAVKAYAERRASSPVLEKIIRNNQGCCQAYVVFFDIVSYTERSTAFHPHLIYSLEIFLDQAFRKSNNEFEGRLLPLGVDLLRDTVVIPIGDGVAVAFPFPELFELPLFFARCVYEAAHKENHHCGPFEKKGWCVCHEKNISMRCGISFGDIYLLRDLNKQFNVAGTPVNEASRLQGVADPGQIFVTANVAKKFIDLSMRRPPFKHYRVKIKHEKEMDAFHYVEKYAFLNVSRRKNIVEKTEAEGHAAPARQRQKQRRPTGSSVPDLNEGGASHAEAKKVGSLQRSVEEATPLIEREVSIALSQFKMGNERYGCVEREINRELLVSATPVTQSLYLKVMGSNPSYFEGNSRPVERVSWMDAILFCNKLTKDCELGLDPVYDVRGKSVVFDLTKNGYRLPTEAEWEYLASGGGVGAEYCLDDVAWHMRNSNGETHDVGTKGEQAFGLYDLLGNVWEWCNDWYEAEYSATTQDVGGPTDGLDRVLRGGSWRDLHECVSTQYRRRNSPQSVENSQGFRVVRLNSGRDGGSKCLTRR